MASMGNAANVTEERQERLAAMRREHARVRAEWERVKAELGKLGDVPLRVPDELLAHLDGRASRAVGTVDVNAVRG